jgi:hypothetical protein
MKSLIYFVTMKPLIIFPGVKPVISLVTINRLFFPHHEAATLSPFRSSHGYVLVD